LQEEIRQKNELSKKRAEEESRRKAEEEEQRQREAEERRKREEEAKKKLEDELQKRREEERIKRQEEKILQQAKEEGNRTAAQQKIEEYLHRAKEFIVTKSYEGAITEVLKVSLLDPENAEARHIEQLIQDEKDSQFRTQLQEARRIPHQVYLDTYNRLLQLAWKEGTPTPDAQILIESLRHSLQVTQDEHSSLEPAVKSESYAGALRTAWQDGTLSPEEVTHLEILRGELVISADEHLASEQKIRRELGY